MTNEEMLDGERYEFQLQVEERLQALDRAVTHLGQADQVLHNGIVTRAREAEGLQRELGAFYQRLGNLERAAKAFQDESSGRRLASEAGSPWKVVVQAVLAGTAVFCLVQIIAFQFAR